MLLPYNRLEATTPEDQMTPYPDTLPVEAVRSLTEMIRTRSIDRTKFGLALWNVQGYAQGMILGTPNQLIGGTNPNPSDVEVLNHLDQLTDNQHVQAIPP